ncbi:TetR/AcrR family transcriptional regulator C-terminal domain-containing protein [Pseudarthrobacter sp. NamE5]|uniref:TetR/AcrR family transcriptional regulator C-terminal domain-containing protein n=1 Tax=Pseudarthrobacter sp. NamE5 TaxID=2576839 RepID=UPI00110A84F1|nr:TetR/AcrR family transcriptional regulator C-terminal domain-containing protein [Pseudarthrobacter sp. NamE5]TLM88298.1 TetR/AcrR family transcriptional regulator [Pseudarthrobacter sp. NamE5]
MPRPRSPLLSVDAIVRAALFLVDSTGDFSFPKVAKQLGVSQAALYNHIENREHIIELMRGLVFSERQHLDTENLPWDEALRNLAREYRDCLVDHPRLVPLLVAQTVRDLGVMRIYEDMATVLAKAGLAPSAIVPAITTVDYLVLGSALELTAPEVVWSPPQGLFPMLSEAIADLGSPAERSNTAFSFGLETLLAGIRQVTKTSF